ncbi:MAG: TolC family protein [Bacteroidales bacterium]|nr:TolC family protein [Bacteroidales bacterium]
MPKQFNISYTRLSGFFISLLMLLLLFPKTLVSQELANEIKVSNESVFNPITDDITKKIPPLDVLIDSALINSHRLKYWDTEIKITEYELKSAKRNWANGIFIQGDAKEGTWTSLSYVQDQYGNEVGTLGTTDQGRYTIGLGLRVPLVDLWDRGNKIKLNKMRIERNIEKMQEDRQAIRANVINLYNELLIQQNMLKLDIDNIEFSELTAEMADKEFQNGKISLSDLSRIRDNLNRARYRYVDSKTGFIKAYVMLQELTGIKFNELNNWE